MILANRQVKLCELAEATDASIEHKQICMQTLGNYLFTTHPADFIRHFVTTIKRKFTPYPEIKTAVLTVYGTWQTDLEKNRHQL